MRTKTIAQPELSASVTGAAALPTWRFGAAALPKPRSLKPLAVAVSLAVGGIYADALAQTNLITDGKTATSVQRNGAVVDVTTGTVKGVNAFNSFRRFEVGQPDTVNLRLPDGTNTLINMVYDAPIRIDGVLNSIKGNQIGGRVVFADPFGMVVGRTGVLNVGSLLVTSPNASFLSGVIGAGGIDDASVGMLLSTKLAQAPGSSVRIDGRINALERVRLQAESVLISEGSVVRVGSAAAQSAAFQMAVNTNGLQQATGIVNNGGVIEIVGAAVTVAGTLDASGASGVSGASHGGTIRVGRVEDERAGSVDIATTAVIKADAGDTGNGGLIDIWGNSHNHFLGVASARGGAQGGDGGFVEVSANGNLFYGGLVFADAPMGNDGKLYIDPNVVCIVESSGNACTTDAFLGTTSKVLVSSLQGGSGNIELEATDGLYIGSSDGLTSANLDLSTRLLSGSKIELYGHDLVQLNAGSQIKTGGGAVTLRTDSITEGDIVFAAGSKITTNGGAINATAETIDLKAGTVLNSSKTGADAGAITLKAREITVTDSEITADGGNVTLEAKATNAMNIFGWKTAESKVVISNSKITGDEVKITAESTIENKPFVPTSTMSDEDFLSYMGGYANVDNAVGLSTNFVSTEALSVLEFLTGIQIVLSIVDTQASVTIDGASQIHGDKSVTISANTLGEAGNGQAYFDTIKGFLTPMQQSKFGLGVGYASAKGVATVDIGGTTKLSGGDLSVLSRNDIKVELEVETANTDSPGSTKKDDALLAIAAGVVMTDAQANTKIASTVKINSGGAVQLASVNYSEVSNSVTASTGAGGKAGAAVALTLQNTQANTTLNADIVDASSAMIIAVDHTVSSTTESVAKVGATPFQRFANNVDAYASEDFLATLSQYSKEKKEFKARTVPLKLAGALALTNENHTAIAHVGDGVTIHTRADAGVEGSGTVLVGARVEDTEITLDASASAISSSSGGQQTGSNTKRGVAAGVAVGMYDHIARATVGEGVTIIGERIGVLSHIEIPLKDLPSAEDYSKESWDSFTKVKDNLGMFNDLLNLSFVNARGRAKGSGEDVGFSGSLTFMFVGNNSFAEVGANSKLLTNSDAAKVNDSYVTKTDYNLIEAKAEVLFDWNTKTLFEPEVEDVTISFVSPGAVSVQATTNSNFILQTGEALNTNEGKGIGVSNGYLAIDSHSDAIVREGVKIARITETDDGADPGQRVYTSNPLLEGRVVDSVVKAYNDTLAVNFTIGAGKSTDATVSGMAVETFIDNRARASVDNEATVKADSFKVEAADTPLVYTIAGTLNMSNQTTIGIGIGVNDIKANTTAGFSDNDLILNADGSVRASKAALLGSLDVNTLSVLAHTGGAIYNIAVAGSASTTDETPGIGAKLNKLNESFNKALCAANNLMGQGDLKCATSAPKQKQDRSGWALTGAGAVAVNTVDLITTATLDGIGGKVTDLQVNATGDADIVTVSGGAAFTLAKAGSKNKGNATFAGAVAVNVIGNKVESHLANTVLSDLKSAEVSALKGGENLSIGLSMAVNTDMQGKDAVGFAGSASITLDLEEDVNGTTQSKNAARSFVKNADLGGLNTGDLNVIAYNSSLIGTGGGSMTTQGKKSVGASVTYAEIGNATEVSIENSRFTGFKNENILAHSAAQIVAAAASASVSIGQKDSTGINGSIVLTNISNSTKAVVKNSQLDGSTSVTVTARDGVRIAGYESRLEQGAVTGDGVDEEGEANGYDYSGSKLFTDSSVAGGSTGSAILGIAGTVQLSTDKTSKNIGASVAYNMIANSTVASVDGSYAPTTLTSGTAGLQVTADSQSYIRSFAVGASAAGDVSVGGSVSVNLIDNTTSATVNNVMARGAQASATDNSNIDSLAGQINVSTESKGVAAGGALAYNQITNAATASVTGSTAGGTGINGGLSGTGSNVSAIAQNTARIRSIAAAGAVAPAGNANAFSGSIGFNLITNTQTATVRNVAMSNMTAGTDLLKARAVDDSDIQALSGAISIGGGAAFGGALSTNTIANDTNALVESVTGTSVETIAAQAWADGDILSMAAGVAASNDKGAIAGSVSINTITNDTSAKLNKATVSGGTLDVSDQNESSIGTIAGAAAVSLSATAIGVAVTTNTIANTHAASVVDSNVTLTGSAAVKASEKASIDSIGASGAVGQGVSVVGAFVVNTVTNGSSANVTNSSISANGATVSATDESTIRALGGAFALSIDKSAVGGAGVANTITNTADVNLDRATIGAGSGLLTVSALNKDKIQALAASAALAGGTAAVGIAGSANTIVNKTRISALGSSIGGTGASIKARDESTVQAFNGAVSISLGTAAVGGAIGINTVTNTVTVDFDDKPSYASTLNGGSGAVTVGAESDQTIEALVAAASGSAGTISGSGSVGNNIITNTTRAQLTDTALKGGSAAISVLDDSDISTLTGAVAVSFGGTAVGLAASNNNIINTNTAGVTGGSVALTTGAFDVSAKSTGDIKSLGAAGAVGSDNAVSGTAVNNIITNTTRAQVSNITGSNTSKGGSVVAEDASEINSIAGSAALGVGGVAVGGAVAVSTITNTTEALMGGTTLNAGTGAFTHTASNSSKIKTLAAAAAGGGGSVAVSASAATNTIVNKTHALMTGTTLTAGNMTQQSRDTALIQTLSGAAAVSLGTVGVGFAASVNTVTNENWSGATGSNLTLSGTLTNDTKSTENIDSIAVAMSAAGGASVSPSVATNTITNSTQASYGTTSVSSTGTTIAATDNSVIRNFTGAAAIDFGGGAAVGGAGSINTIKNSTQALVTGGTWGTGAGAMSVSALNSESIKTIAASAAVSANVGVAGSIVTGVVNNVTRAKVSGATITGSGLTVKAEDKANIDMVAGALGVGVGAAGVGAALNGVGIANTVEATLHNTSATLGSGTGNVTALSQSTINSLAVAGAGSGGVSVGGSDVTNVIDNTTAALIDGGSVSAGTIGISSSDTSTINTLAGAAAFSGGASVGAAMAINTMTNETTARTTLSTLTAGAGGASITSTSGETINTAAVAGAGSGGVAVAGSIAINVIANTTRADVDGSSVLAGTSGNVTVAAQDTATIASASGSAAVGGGTSVGVGASSNTITNTIEARIRGVALSGTGGYQTVTGNNVVVSALSKSKIQSLAAGIAADATAGVGGSASINVIGTNVRAVVDRSADVLADDNALITANSNDNIYSIAGSAGIGIAAAGVGVATGVAVVTGETSAIVGGNNVSGVATKLDARANGGTSSITTGEITSVPTATLTNPSAEFILGNLSTTTQNVSGVAVTAQAMRHFANGAFSLGGGSVGVGGTINANAVAGTTEATIQGAQVNQRGGADTDQDVNVIAASHTYGSGFAGAVGVGAYAGVGVAVEGSGYNVATKARILNSTTSATNNATVKARATEGIATLDAGGGFGTVGVQGTANIGVMRGSTEAVVYGGTLSSDALTVKAYHDANFGSFVGAVSGGAVGVAGSMGVLVNAHTTTARIGASTTDASETATTTINASAGHVVVDAESQTNISQTVVSGSAGGFAFAGAIGVTVLDDVALATVNKTTMNTPAGNVTVEASVDSVVQQAGGAAAIGFGGGGVGASLGLALVRGQADAWIANSNVTANNVTVDAKNTQDLDALSAAGGFDAFAGIGGSIQISMIGLGSSSTGTKADSELSGVTGLDKANTFATKDRIGGEQTGGSVDQTNSSKTKFSTDSKNAVNSANSYDFKAKMNSPLANTTRARISNSTIATTTAVDVSATSATALRNSVGAAGVGLAAGVAAGISVAKVSNQVTASIDSASLLQGRSSAPTVTVKALAKDKDGNWGGLITENRDTIVNRAIAAGGALGGAASAAVSVGIIDNTITANLDAGSLGGGAVTVHATDETNGELDAMGAQVGGGAFGVAVAVANRSGSVTADFTPTGNSTITSANVQALAKGALSANVLAASGGIGFSVSGNVADVRDSLNVVASVGSGASFNQTGGLTVKALHQPNMSADVAGVGISAGLQAGVSSTSVVFTGDTTASVDGTGAFGSGASTVLAQNQAASSGYNLDAYALSAGGGLLMGANGAVAYVEDSSDVSATWVADALPAGHITVEALRATSQHAEGTAYSGGIVGVGAVVSTSKSTGNTEAKIDGLTVASTGRTGNITVNANAGVNSRAEATAGTGGIVAGSAAVAKNILTGSTVAAINANSGAAFVRGNNVSITATRRNEFNGRVDTVNASVVGASGAFVDNTVNTSTTAEVGAGTNVRVNNFTLNARSVGMKNWWTGSVNGTPNIKSASGGLIDAPSSTSSTDYRQTTAAKINNNAVVAVDYDNGLGSDSSVVRLDASSDITLRDNVVMNSGGAIPVATGVSKQEVKQDDNSVLVGSGAQIIAPRGNIYAGSRTDTDLDARVSVDTYGLAGAPDGVAWAKYTGGNTLTIDENALVQASRGNIYLGAGVSSSGALNRFLINSDVHTWNKTAIPIAGGPDAVSALNTSSLVLMKSGSIVEAGTDIDLVSLTGTDDVNLVFGVNTASKVTSVGIGKDVYRELAAAVVSGISNAFGGDDVSFDIKKNTITRNTNGTVQIDKDATARVGLSRSEKLVIDEKITSTGKVTTYDENGVETGQVDTYDVGYTITTRTGGIGTIDSAIVTVGQETWNRILWLRQKEVDYAGTTEALGYANERKFLESRLVDQGLATRNSDGTIDFGRGSTGGLSPRAMAQAQLDLMNSQKAGVQNTLTEKLTAKTTVETTETNIGSLITKATAISQGQGVITGDATSLTALADIVTTKTTAKTNADNTLASATTTYNTRVTEQASAQTAYNSCSGTTDCANKLAALNTANTNLSNATTAKNNAQTAATTAATELTTAQGNVTTKQNTINTWIGEFNTLQTTLTTAETNQNLNIVTQISGITTYANQITQANINTFSTEKTAYNTSVVKVKVDDYNSWNASAGQLLTDITNLSNKISSLSDVAISGSTTTQLTIPNIAITLGDVRIQGNTLKGGGNISAPGDASVTITNNSSAQLKVKDISISSTGGNIRLNGFLVDNNADINKINDVDGAASGASFNSVNTRRSGANLAEIKINSTYDPNNVTEASQRRPSPDITLIGNIFNPEGLVSVKSQAGSILSQGNIRAGIVDIQATNGDFVQSYQNGFFHVGSDPQYRYQDSTKINPMGIVANGAVLLNARYLNINGNVQSGIANWQVTLGAPSTMYATGDATFFGVNGNEVLSFRAAYMNNRGSGTVPTSGTGSRYKTFTGTGGLQVTYDAETDELYAGYTQTASLISAPGGMYRMKAASSTDNIGYSYDSVNDRFVIDGTAVKGGYIKLFGQIMNTEPNTTTAKDANGVSIYNGSSTLAGLKVMDGYGSITVTNNSGKKVVLGNIDAGTGAMGVIEISDIQSVNATTQVPSVKHTTITRDADGHVLTKQWWNNDAEPTTYTTNAVGRTWSYAPQAGMRYQYTTGTDESTIREYQRVTRNFFNADSLGVDEWYQGELIRGPFIQNKYDIPGGQRLILGSALTDYFNNTSTTLANGTPTMAILRQWSECDPWLCITSRKYTQYRVTTPTKTIYYNTVKADYNIPINFIGSDSGTISVVSNADLLLQGSLRNINGTTTLNATAGSIKSIANTSNITSKAVVLQASGSVGGAEGDGGPIRLYSAADVNHPANGVPNLTLSGYANGGNFTARHFSANTVLGDISSSGTISIMAKGNILSGGATSELTAQRVELNSSEGSVGSITGDAPINLRIKSTDDPNLFTSYGVKVQAYGDINLYSQTHAGSASGDMLVESIVSGTGNVRLKSDGKILDGNPVETIDERTWNQLLSYWDSVQLRGTASVEKQDAMVASYVANVNRDYQNYWEIRARQEEQTGVATYDAGYSYALSANEITAFTEAGLNSSQIAQYQTDKTADYHRLHARMATLESSAGSLTTSYSAGFSYQVVTNPANVGAGALLKTGTLASGASTYASTEVTGMLKGSSWSDKELGIALTPGLIKEVTNTNVVVKAPNVRGNTIELYTNAGVGDRVSPGLNIDLTGDPSLLTNAQKVALAAAERSDISISPAGIATVLQNKPLNVLGSNLVAEGLTGGLSTGNIFIASRGGIAVNSVQTSKELRLKVIGNITNGTNAANVAAINANIAILESGDNAIGSTGSLLRVASNGTNSAYVARAAKGVYMGAPTGDLNIDTVYSPGDIVLFSTAGAIKAVYADTAMDIRGKSVNLQAAGNIGSSTHFFDVGVDPDQLITAKSTGGGIYLRGTEGAAFNLGNVDAVTDVVIDGFINPVIVKNNINTTGNISITGGKDIEFKSGVSVTAGVGGVTIEAGDDVLVNTAAVIKAGKGASVGGDNITINGTLTTQTGNIRVNADEGDVVLGAGGLVRAVGIGTLDVIAAEDILMNVSSQMISGGLARLNAQGGEIKASSVQGGSVEANALTTIQGVGSGNIHFRATDLAGSVWLNRKNDSSSGLVTGTGIGTGTQAVRVSAVNGYATTKTGDIDLRLDRASTFSSIATGGGDVTVVGVADITAQTVSATGDIDISNGAGNTRLTNMKTTAGSMKVNSAGTLYINDAKAPGGATFTSVGLATLGKIDTTGAGNVRADLTVNATQGITASNLIADDIALGSTNGALYVSAFDATGNLNASSPLGALTLYGGKAAGDITAVGQSVTSNSLSSTGGDISLNAQGGSLTYTTLTAADAMNLQARDRITGNSAATAKAQNAVDMTANDITAGTITSTAGGITLTGKTTDVLTAALSAGGSIVVNANRNVSLTSTTGVANAGGELSATATTGTLNVNNSATSVGTMTLNSAKAMTVGTLTTTGTDSDMMITASAGALNFRTLDSKRHLTATVRDAIVRSATTGLGFKAGGNVVITGGSTNQLNVAAQGSVNITSKSGLTVDGNNNTGAVNLVGVTGSSVNIKSAYDLIATGRIQSLSGDIDLEAGRNMTINETFSFGRIGLKAVQNATLIKVQYGAGFFATIGGTLRVTTVVAPSTGSVVISATSVTGITPTP